MASSAVVIPVASVPYIITTILDDDRFKKELASLVDKQITMNSALLPSVVLCKDVPVTTLTVAAEKQKVDKSKRQKVDKIPKVKTCIFKGCKVMENDIKLLYNSCPKHYNYVKARGNKQRTKYSYNKKIGKQL